MCVDMCFYIVCSVNFLKMTKHSKSLTSGFLLLQGNSIDFYHKKKNNEILRWDILTYKIEIALATHLPT